MHIVYTFCIINNAIKKKTVEKEKKYCH